MCVVYGYFHHVHGIIITSFHYIQTKYIYIVSSYNHIIVQSVYHVYRQTCKQIRFISYILFWSFFFDLHMFLEHAFHFSSVKCFILIKSLINTWCVNDTLPFEFGSIIRKIVSIDKKRVRIMNEMRKMKSIEN